MPRNSSGVYSLPNPPVVPDTIISSTDENTTRADMETELTSSLDRSGRGGMLAALRGIDGIINVPSYSWTSETTSGWYRKNLNDFWYAIAGQDVFNINGTGIDVGVGMTSPWPASSLFSAKGSMLAATAASTPADLPVGTDGQVLIASAAAAQGVAWATPSTFNPATATNRIINGKFAIDQRNAGAAVTVNTSGVHFGPDRWWGSTPGAGSAFTLQREADSSYPGEYRLKIAVTVADAAIAAADNYYVVHAIEGSHVTDLYAGSANAQQITLAFEVESTITGTFPIAFRNSAANRSYVGTYTVNVANTREQKSITLTLDTSGTWLTTTGVGLSITFGLLFGSTFQAAAADVWSAGTFGTVAGTTNFMGTVGNTMRLKNVRLYRGAVDLGVDQRLYAEELALCQRYYWKTYLQGDVPGAVAVAGFRAACAFSVAASTAITNIDLPVVMRTSPTVTLYSHQTGAAGQWRGSSGSDKPVSLFSASSDAGFVVQNTGALVVTELLFGHAVASAEL